MPSPPNAACGISVVRASAAAAVSFWRLGWPSTVATRKGDRMSDMSWEHASEARAALNAIVTDPEHGVSALSNPQTMSNLLKDYLPDAPREKSILVAAAEAGLADTLREHVAQGMDPNTAIRLTASSFSSSTPFTPEACNWVTDEIAIALGITQPGSGSGGQMGGTPPGFAPLPGEGMPTQMAGGSPGGFGGQQGQSPGGGQAFGQSPAGAIPQEQPTAQGYRPGYGPGQPGQPAQPGGYPGQAGTPAPGYPGGQTAAPGLGGAQTAGPGFPGQPGYPGQQGGFPGQPGYQGQPGFPGQQGTPGGWQPGGFGPGAPVTPYPSGGSGGQGGSRRGLLVGGGIAVLVIIVIIAVF